MNQELFNYLSNELGATATLSEMGDIEDIVRKQPGKHCSDELAELLYTLRHQQREFFKSNPGSLDRIAALERSKKLEKELDNFLKERAAPKPQPKLF